MTTVSSKLGPNFLADNPVFKHLYNSCSWICHKRGGFFNTRSMAPSSYNYIALKVCLIEFFIYLVINKSLSTTFASTPLYFIILTSPSSGNRVQPQLICWRLSGGRNKGDKSVYYNMQIHMSNNTDNSPYNQSTLPVLLCRVISSVSFCAFQSTPIRLLQTE